MNRTMEIYLDNAATTRCYTEVRDIVAKVMTEDFGNPSAMHKKGVEAEQYIKSAKETLGRLLKVNPEEVFFTSGGTEANNLALIGGALANQRAGKEIITTQIEHAAVGMPARYLEESGFSVTYLPVDGQGVVSLDALEKALTPETILVSVMYVNNEVGSLQPIEKIGRILREKAPKTLFHVDAIQAFGKYRIYPRKLGVNALSVSGHKIHGPKGVGFLYIDEKIKIRPQILGGGQQNGMRSGTDNVPGVAGLGVAAWEIYQDFDNKIAHLYEVKTRFCRDLRSIEGVQINGQPIKEGAPHIVSASFSGIRSEVLLHALEERGIYVSAGSACASHRKKESATLKAMGLSKEQRETALRFSFSEDTTTEEADQCLQALKELVPMLRRYTRR